MDGDIETQPLIYRDKPTERGLRLMAPVGQRYETWRIEEVADEVAKLQANEPEIIRTATVGLDQAQGRLAVAMTVYGDHATLHGKAPEWLAVLRGEHDSNPLGYAWAVGH